MTFHHKKPFDPSGDVYANSVTRTMKSQALSAWDMFTREALQNSWDARDQTSQKDGVTFAIDYVELNPEQVQTLDEEVFGGDYSGIPRLEEAFSSGQLSALCVSDSGTHGLRGPSVATAATDGPTDFNSFIRNIGRSDTKEIAGGTYGFGKGVFFIASTVQTIVVYTRTTDEKGNRVNRLIAMANADDFFEDKVAYTGRHWWGEYAVEVTGADRTEFAEPYTGKTADRIAAALGIDSYFNDERSTGTTIMILEPDLSVQDQDGSTTETPQRTVMKQISHSLTRWAWPHMLDIDTGMDPIEFSVSYKREQIRIVPPKEDPAVKHFVSAYCEALGYTSPTPNKWEHRFFGRIATIAASRPKKALGVLSLIDLTEAVPADRTLLDRDISSHVATMRKPRMIVEYYKAPESSTGKPYCGVFIANDEADAVFARSEPAAHHQWNYQTVKHDTALLQEFWDSLNNPVSIFFTKMKDLIKSVDPGSLKNTKSQHFRSATKLSESLGSLIANAQGATGNKSFISPQPPKKKSKRASKTRGRFDSEVVKMKNTGSGTVVSFRVTATVPKHLLPASVMISPTVNSDRGDIRSALSQMGAQVPEVLSLREYNSPETPSNASNTSAVEESVAGLLEKEHVEFLVDVLQPFDTAISLNIEFEYNTDKDLAVFGGASDE